MTPEQVQRELMLLRRHILLQGPSALNLLAALDQAIEAFVRCGQAVCAECKRTLGHSETCSACRQARSAQKSP